jgi:class 3 adenylate cyclase
VGVLVADMRGFTDTAEGLPPEELFETLNAYPEPMVEIAARHPGMVDKFTGDGFMVVFGVPCATGSEPELPLTAAVELAEAVEARSRARAGSPRLDLGYGVHWGTAAAGSLASLLRMEHTAVGDTVNVAHRVQAPAASGEILATRATLQAPGNGFRWVGPGPRPS